MARPEGEDQAWDRWSRRDWKKRSKRGHRYNNLKCLLQVGLRLEKEAREAAAGKRAKGH